MKKAHDIGVIMNLLRLSMRAGVVIGRDILNYGADLFTIIFIIITFVLITPFILWF